MSVLQFVIHSESAGEQRRFERPLFPHDLKERLLRFCECASALNASAFVKNWPQTRISIHLGNDSGITNTGKLPSDDEIAAFLHRLRPFYLINEETNFDRVANQISQHLLEQAITENIRHWKRHYDGRGSQQVFEISVAGKIVNSGEFFDHYVNALEYHRDSARRKHIDAIAEHFPLEAQKAIFVLLLGIRLQAINKVAHFLRTCFDREDGRPITIQMP